MTPRPVVCPGEIDDINLADPRLHAERELSDLWRYLRAERPFYRQPERGSQPGFWVISRYQDAMAVYRDKEHFTTQGGNALATLLTGGDPASQTMLAVTDGIRHTRIRNILMKAFSPRMLSGIQPRVKQTVDELLAAATEQADCDFVRDVSGKVPLGAICELLAVPPADREYLLGLTSRAWSSDEAGMPPEDSWTAKSEILLYFSDLARTRRGRDQDDVVSLLANCRIDGEPLTDAELMANCYGVMIGGDETGRHAITGGLLALMENPDQWRALKRGEVNLGTAADEVLRWTVPSLHGGRTVIGDTTVNGHPLRDGEFVSVWITSANRDGEIFPDPDRFLLNRAPNKHLTFAFGAHFCLGSYLAQVEIELVLDALRRTVATAVQTGPERWIYSSILHGMSSLPVFLERERTRRPQ